MDPQSGKLRVIVWRDDAHHDAGEPSELPARLLSAPVFDCPQDVHASRVLSTPVAWSFAIRELSPGTDLTLPADLAGSLKAKVEGSADSAAPAGADPARARSRMTEVTPELCWDA